jgi:hypothetical protein
MRSLFTKGEGAHGGDAISDRHILTPKEALAGAAEAEIGMLRVSSSIDVNDSTVSGGQI